MGKRLVIAEKPSVAMDYAAALMCKERKEGYVEGKDYVITWAFGHLFTLKEPADYDEKYKVWDIEALPIIPGNFEIKLNKGAAKQFSVIKNLIHRSDIDNIIVGTDAGREGELIARYILLAAKSNKTVQRLWISTLTEADIKKGFKELKPISSYDNLYYAAAARNEIDWLMGINYTRAYTKKKGKNVLLSIGRCQTPILNLIVQRDLQIEKFVPEPYCEVTADFGDYVAKYIKNNSSRIDDKEAAEKIKDDICNGLGEIAKVETEKKSKPHPQLYNLTNLQRVMNRKYGYSAQKTLDTAQELYEKHKILSYPRTSSRHLSESLIPEFPERLDCLSFGNFNAAIDVLDMNNLKTSKRFIDDSKISDHHAIIPTLNKNIKDIYEQLSKDEKLLFDEVVLSFISCFYPDYIYEHTTVLTTVEKHEFITKGKRDIELGWKIIYQEAEENNEGEDPILPELIEGETRKVIKAEIENKMTKPQARFTEDSLLSQLEKFGIGTEATRAGLIEILLKRGYIERNKKSLAPTDLGKDLIASIETQELKSAELTAELENKLEEISKGEAYKNDVVGETIKKLKGEISKLKECSCEVIEKHKEELGICPVCKNGHIVQNKVGYGCSDWKNGCKFFVKAEIAGKKITIVQVKKLIAKGKTDVIKGFKSKSGKPFDAALTLKDGNATFLF